MAVAPLFVADMTSLKSSLRLSSAAQPDTLRAIDDAVLKVRMGFYDRLQEYRVGQLIATPYTDMPTNKDQVMRVKANLAEIAWVRLELYRTLPILFMDASGQAREDWQELQLIRDKGPSALAAEIERLQAEVDDYLSDLATNEATESSINVSTIGPTHTPPIPGESASPRRRYVGWGWN